MTRISDKCLYLYADQYPDDGLILEESTGGVLITRSDKDGSYIQPIDETNESFVDRIERSKTLGRNLFYSEWEHFEYDDDADY